MGLMGAGFDESLGLNEDVDVYFPLFNYTLLIIKRLLTRKI